MKNLKKILGLAIALAMTSSLAHAGSYTTSNYCENGACTFNSATTFAAGSVASSFKPEGLASSQFSAAGVGNAADTTDDVLFSYTLPASALNTTGQAIEVTCFGGTAANGNNKTIKLWFGSELISSGVITDSNKNWTSSMVIGRTGASAQLVRATMVHDTSTITPYLATGAETDTAAITIKCTGASGTTGAAGDVVGRGMFVRFSN
ncbi:hypothetical protein [Zavarzinella formosa]|uniref:hypothetical protein n=1 Tax=Zavarzinella formosa TaxID=360055 RepID=UPI0002D65247|nr:hypothetical protein [Zavarzinella formosa]